MRASSMPWVFSQANSGGSAGDLADSTVAYSSPCGGEPLAGKLASSGGMEDRGDQEIDVAVVDPGDGAHAFGIRRLLAGVKQRAEHAG